MRPAKLIVEDQDGSSRTLELTEAETLIGRSASSDVRLGDKSASREHCAISWEGDHFVVEDLQTTNGTRINGKRVRSGKLNDGDQIQIGQTLITFRYT